MGSLLKVVVAVLAGVLCGLLVTIRSLDLDAVGVDAGPWHGLSRSGSTNEADPYALAADARASLLPLGAAEGLTFLATHDSDGAALTARCDYRVEGAMPTARAWTVSLLTPQGFPTSNAAERYGFTSSEVLRYDDAPATIVVSTAARAGNWLPIGTRERFTLMLRLYDTSLSTTGSVLTGATMPKIARAGCRP